jgi:hypothetical protein
MLNDKIAAHEQSTRREMEASQRAADALTATLHRQLAELHQQQAESLRGVFPAGYRGAR